MKAPVDWEQFDLTGHVSSNDALMKDTLASLRRNKVGLKGTLYTPVSKMGHASFNVSMRKVRDYNVYIRQGLIDSRDINRISIFTPLFLSSRTFLVCQLVSMMWILLSFVKTLKANTLVLNIRYNALIHSRIHLY